MLYFAGMIKRPYLVGITGGSASGKTAFIQSLKTAFNSEDLCLISQDNYYKEKDQQPLDENGHINYDLPDCIHVENFLGDIDKLKRGESIFQKEYLFQLEGQEPNEIELKPAPIIVVDGLFIFYFQEILEQLDLKIFIDASEPLKLARRLKRDTAERGVPEEHVLYQWEKHVLPAYTNFLLPYKDAADIVVNNNEHFLTSLEVIIHHFQTKLKE